MLFRYNLSIETEQIAPFLRSVSELASASGGIPPFMAVDHEGGDVHRFGRGVTRLPAPLSFWDMADDADGGWEKALAAVEDAARKSGGELRALGITVNLAPVAEVLSEENRAFLDTRSYGPDADFVAAAAAAFIRGMEQAGVICVVKHFPGNTGVDPHSKTSVLVADGATLNAMTAPMAALLRRPTGSPTGSRNPPMVMVSHVLVPAWDGERSASLSPRIIQDWLRGEMGFTGVILADDFSMGAVSSTKSAEAAVVEALNAGVDMVMAWPSNINAIHAAILAALANGGLSRDRLREAAVRIIAVKLRAGLLC
jgi:beta-N-acetylhexosaminidase